MIKRSFQKAVQIHSEQPLSQSGIFTEQEIEPLPEPVRHHLKAAGYIGKPKPARVTAYMRSVPLKDSNDKPPMIVDYTLCSYAYEPVRLAYIKTSVFGLPFEAFDSTQGGVGFMKGVIAKAFTLFNETGPEMDKAQLMTYLGECFLLPTSIIGGFITWEPIDGNSAKATISYRGISGSGIFTFSDTGFVRSFYTDERARIGKGGEIDYPGWSVVYEDFREKAGIYTPKRAKTIWHEKDGDLVYFDASDISIVY